MTKRRQSGPQSDEELEDSDSNLEPSLDQKEDDSDTEEPGPIEVSFECFRPRPVDASTIRMFLNGYLDKNSFSAGELAMAIADQEFVGSTIRVSDEEDVLAFLTCLNVSVHRSTEFMSQLVTYLLKKCPQKYKDTLDELLNSRISEKTGLLIHERMINIPNELAIPLWQSCEEELSWAVEDGVAEFDFEYFIYLTYKYTPVLDIPKLGGKKKKKKRSVVPQVDCTPFYTKFEDEVFDQHSSYSFTIPYHFADDKPGQFDFDVKTERLVLVLKKENLKKALKKAAEIITVPDNFELYDRDLCV
ncbi:hypothetical protein P9112_008666 [Eukaryota sp. TZLM1-RC]